MNLIIEFVLALGSLILLHELGHFIAGKLLKFEIEEFGIGYPPKLLTLFKAGGTEFTINLIPFGGFVRFKGENDAKVENGFYSMNKWKRFFSLIAGPVMNLLIGVLLFSTVFSTMGKPMTDQVLISLVEPDTPAYYAGLMEGDRILKVDEAEIDSMETISILINSNLGDEIQISILRGEEEIILNAIPRESWPENQGPLGIVMTNPIEQISFFEAISSSIDVAWFQARELLATPIRLIRGTVEPAEVRLLSPKGIYDVYSQVRIEDQSSGTSSKNQLVGIAWFMGVISVSLGISNLLPIPALDGGRLLFLLPELVVNKKIPHKFENVVNLVGFTILIIIMLVVFVQDFTNPIVLPK